MTTPVTLYGTQSNGETLPVQVNEFGQLVAEGLQGSEGQQGPQGDQGPQGEPGADGEGVPKPYGEEGSYLAIQDGAPAWVAGGSPGPEPEPEPAALIQNSSSLSYSVKTYDSNSNPITVNTDWDQWAQLQAPWNGVPSGYKLQGIGFDMPKENWTIKSLWNFEKAHGQVFEIEYYCAWESAYNDPSGDYGWNFSASSPSSFLSPISTSKQFRIPSSVGSWMYGTGKLQWLCTRDAEADLQINIQMVRHIQYDTKPHWFVLRTWRLVDPGRVALERQLALEERMRAYQEWRRSPRAK